jgi:hypothetical protein
MIDHDNAARPCAPGGYTYAEGAAMIERDVARRLGRGIAATMADAEACAPESGQLLITAGDRMAYLEAELLSEKAKTALLLAAIAKVRTEIDKVLEQTRRRGHGSV